MQTPTKPIDMCPTCHQDIYAPTKTCRWCKKPFARKAGEHKAAYDRRSFCDAACAARERAARQRETNPRKETPVKTCPQCQTTFTRPPVQSVTAFMAKRCCSVACSNRLKRQQQGHPAEEPPRSKRCTHCGEVYVKRRTQSWRDFNQSVVCSIDCQNALHRAKDVPIRNEKDCEICGSTYRRKSTVSYATFERSRACSIECRWKIPHKRGKAKSTVAA